MKLRALTLENVRKFGGRTVTLDEMGDGLTVVCEANEFGKSTFFDALHALFFEKYGSTAKPVKSLQPHAGGGLRIAAEVEIDTGRFRVEKRFLAQKGAVVEDLARGTVIARDGEAEDWIAALFGAEAHGPAGLLWVRQGVVGLEPADSSRTEKERMTEARRDLMSSVAGEIDQVTGGRKMDRILRRCLEDLERIATPATGRPRGEWKEAEESARALRAELDVLQAQCADLSEALDRRRAVEDEMRRIDDPAEKARREADAAAARRLAQAAEAHAREVAAAHREVEIAGLRHTGAQADATALRAAIDAVTEAGTAVAAAGRAATGAKSDHAAAQSAEAAARAAHEAADACLAALRSERRRAERAEAARAAAEAVTRLQADLTRAHAHRTARTTAQEAVRANPATPKALAAAEDAVNAAARLRSAVAAQSAQLTVAYSGAARLVLNGAEVAEGAPLTLDARAEIEMPGLGRMILDLPRGAEAEERETAFAAALDAEAAALAACGADTLAAARAGARRRQDDENAMKLAGQMLDAVAPRGLEPLEQALAAAQARATGTPEAADAPAPRPLAEVEAGIEEAESAVLDARATHVRATATLSDRRAARASAEAALAAARDRQDRAAAQAGPEEARAAALQAATEAVGTAATDLAGRRDALAALTDAAPDLRSAEANLKRAEAALDVARKRRAQLAETRADLTARIETRAEEGVEARRDEIAGRLDATDRRAARFRTEAEALTALRGALESARDAAREAYFGPVQEELEPLLRILHDDAGLDWESDSVKPGALRRGTAIEDFETLSGGTQEQIAILTRLAFARLFARRGQHLPIILDDALVYSDDDRIVKMFTALNRVAMDQQIIVFSCRQLAFAGLGGDRPQIRTT